MRKIVSVVIGVLLLTLLLLVGSAAAVDDVYLGTVYVYGLYDFDEIDLGTSSTWSNAYGNTVTFIKDPEDDTKFFISDSNVEGVYTHYYAGKAYHIEVKYPTAAVKGYIYQNSIYDEPIGALIDSVVQNNQYITISGATDIAFTKPDGTLTAVNLSVFEFDPSVGSVRMLDLGIWTAQALFKKGQTYAELGGITLTTVAPDFVLGKPYYFTVVSSDSTKKLEALTEEVHQGNYAAIELTAPMGNWNVSVENGEIPYGQPQVYSISTSGNIYHAEIAVPASHVASFYVKATSSSDIKVRLYDQGSDRVLKSITIRVISGCITASADVSSVYIGNKFDIEGTNDLGGPLYFFIKGTNYPLAVLKNNYGEVLTVSGKVWSETIDTSAIKKSTGKNVDAGTYTIYVVKLADGVTVNQISNTANLDDAGLVSAYTTVSVAFKQPFITITGYPEVLVQGEKLEVSGTAEGEPYDVQYYLFGTNYFRFGYAPVVNGKFTVQLSKTQTKQENMAAGQYFLVVQHPMYDKTFNIGAYTEGTSRYQAGDVVLNKYGSWDLNNDNCMVLFNAKNRHSANAAQALCDALDSQDIDDMYAKVSFIVAGPTSYIDAIPSQIAKGQELMVSGTTTGHVGDVVTVELLSTAFAAIPKEAVGSASFVARTTRIGDDGFWSVSFDTSTLNADEYTCSVAVGQLAAVTTKVTIVEGSGPWPTPTYGFENQAIYPSGSLVPGERVTATVDVKLPRGSVDTASRLSLATPLSGESWVVDIIKAGTIVNTRHPGYPYLYISGFDLDYDADLTVRVSVTGTVSSLSSGKEISVLQITKSGMHDRYAQSYSSPKQFVYNTATLNGELAVLGNAISTLGTRIAAYTAYERDTGKAQSYTEQARSKYVAAQNAGTADAVTAFGNIEAGNKLVKQAEMELALCALSMSLSYTSAVDDTVTTLYSKGWNTEAKLLDTKNAGLKNIYSQLLSVYNAGNVPDAAALDQLAADSLALWEEGNSYLESSLLTTLKLSPGWNFISVPTKLAAVNDTAAELFTGVNTDNKAPLIYNAESKLWEQVTAPTEIKPLNAYWIYSVDEITLTPEFDRGAHTPGLKTLKKGWNAVGLSAEKPMPASVAFNGLNWRTYLSWNAAGQMYSTPIIKGVSGTYGEENPVSLYKGGWIYMEEDGTYLGYA